MKKFLFLLLPSFLLAATTTRVGLEKPDFQSTRWDLPINRNYDIIDSSMVVYPVNLNSGVTGTLPAANTVSSTVYTSVQNSFTDTNNFQAISVSSISVNGPINTNLSINQCVQTGAGGLLTTVGAGCGGGGASALGVNQNGVQVTTPTRALNGLSPPFLITAVGAGATAQWTLDSSSVTLRGTNVINLQSSLQSGATFFVSSGTVFGQMTANKIVVSTLSVSGETTLSNLRVTGGNGLTVDNLTSDRCVQTTTGGQLTVSAGVCNGAGSGDAILSSTQTFTGIDTFTHQINVAGIGSPAFTVTSTSMTVTGIGGLNTTFGMSVASMTVRGSTVAINNVTYNLPPTGGSSGQTLTTSGGASTANLTWVTPTPPAGTVVDSPVYNVGVYSSSPNGTSITGSNQLTINGSAIAVLGDATFTGQVKINNPKTLANLASTTPNTVGWIYYCSDCVTDTICISTQVVTASWARISAKGTACQ